ncbi:PAS domain-containing protein [Alteromonas flava]|uniref:PAS domain-containing protein n=1 Tax=Alteromonas flava TaxID=2048003 RepID=UPI0013D9B725|nr:PAS domain-containing protein [Alteromonas flava]
MTSLKQLIHFASQVFDEYLLPVIATDNKTDGYYKIIYVNIAFCQITGYSPSELLGKSPSILQGERSNQRTLRLLEESLLKGNGFSGVSFNYRKNNEAYPVRWNITPFKDDDGIVLGFLSVQRDLSGAWNLLNKLTKENKALKRELNALKSSDKHASPDKSAHEVADGLFFDFDAHEESSIPIIQKEAINAQTFIENALIEEDELRAIDDILCELQALIIMHIESLDNLDECNRMTSLVSEFSRHISFLIEFTEVSDAISELSVAFDEAESKTISEIVLQSLRELVDELCLWFKNIFIEQSSNDIHALDASIIANSKQIMMFLNVK